jgi:hypothetical protein
MSTLVWCDRPDEIGPLMRSKSEGWSGKGRSKKRTTGKHRDGAGPSKVGADRVGDRLHGDRVVLRWGDQRWASLTKAAQTTGLGFRRPLRPTMTSVSNLKSMRWFRRMLARAKDIGKIVHELELAGVRHTITPTGRAAAWRLAGPACRNLR